MILTLSHIRHKLDACEKEILRLEEISNHMKVALKQIPFFPSSRKHIRARYLRCAKDIKALKSKMRNVELLWIKTGKDLFDDLQI